MHIYIYACLLEGVELEVFEAEDVEEADVRQIGRARAAADVDVHLQERS